MEKNVLELARQMVGEIALPAGYAYVCTDGKTKVLEHDGVFTLSRLTDAGKVCLTTSFQVEGSNRVFYKSIWVWAKDICPQVLTLITPKEKVASAPKVDLKKPAKTPKKVDLKKPAHEEHLVSSPARIQLGKWAVEGDVAYSPKNGPMSIKRTT